MEEEFEIQKVKLSTGKEITLKEIGFEEGLDKSGNVQTQSPKESARRMIRLSMVEPQMTDEEFDKFMKSLKMKDGMKMTNTINEMNGIGQSGFTVTPVLQEQTSGEQSTDLPQPTDGQ